MDRDEANALAHLAHLETGLKARSEPLSTTQWEVVIGDGPRTERVASPAAFRAWRARTRGAPTVPDRANRTRLRNIVQVIAEAGLSLVGLVAQAISITSFTTDNRSQGETKVRLDEALSQSQSEDYGYRRTHPNGTPGTVRHSTAIPEQRSRWGIRRRLSVLGSSVAALLIAGVLWGRFVYEGPSSPRQSLPSVFFAQSAPVQTGKPYTFAFQTSCRNDFGGALWDVDSQHERTFSGNSAELLMHDIQQGMMTLIDRDHARFVFRLDASQRRSAHVLTAKIPLIRHNGAAGDACGI